RRYAQAHFVRIAGAVRTRAVDRVHADEIRAQFERRCTDEAQPFVHDLAGQAAPRDCAGAGVRDLSFADPAVELSDRGLERGRPRPSARAVDAHAIAPE